LEIKIQKSVDNYRTWLYNYIKITEYGNEEVTRVENMIRYPALEGKIAERGIRKKDIAEALTISPRALSNKLTGKTDFTWNEVVTIRDRYFQDMAVEALMARNPA
jgi:predicted transcriptional regulator